MNQQIDMPENRRNIWVRGLFMVLMLLVYHVCGTVLCIVAAIQFVIVLTGGEPNGRLVTFGRGLGSYLRQIAGFLAFATEEMPFPFGDWPAG